MSTSDVEANVMVVARDVFAASGINNRYRWYSHGHEAPIAMYRANSTAHQSRSPSRHVRGTWLVACHASA
jgi:hypothetical protein